MKKLLNYRMVRKSGISEPLDYDVLVTEPDQVKPLDAILKNRQAGIAPPMFNGVYLGEDAEMLELNKMDALEVMEFRQNLSDRMDQIQIDYHEATRKLAELDASRSKGSADEGGKTPAQSEASPSDDGAKKP